MQAAVAETNITAREQKSAFMRVWRESHRAEIAAYDLAHKEEESIRHKAWAKANPELVAAKNRRFRESHRDYDREYYEENKVRITATNKAWAEANPEKVKERGRLWAEENPGKVKSKNHIKRARKCQATIETFPVLEVFERDSYVCQLCHKKVNRRLKWPHPLSATLDHIVALAKGGAHSRQNTQLAHLVCNMRAFTGGVKQLRLL